jgi:ankyrin repeat protein
MSANRIRRFAGRSLIAFVCLLLLQNFSLSFTQPVSRGQAAEALLDAIAMKDTNAAARMIESNTNLANATDYMGKLPLLEAAAAGNVQLVKRLIELGAKINARGDTLGSAGAQNTALHVAIRHNQPAVCKFLLEAGADSNLAAFGYTTPLHLAFTENREEMAGLLLDFGADPFREKLFVNDRTTPFELAITHTTGRLVPRMLRASRVSSGALKPGAELLVENKPRPMKKEAAQLLAARGTNMLAVAAQRGELEAVEALLDAGVAAKGAIAEGAPLLQAFALAYAGAEKAKDFPVERWIRIRELLEKNGAPLDVFAATGLGDLESARRLVIANPSLARARDHEQQTPLHWAVLTDQLPFTAFWLEAGVPPSAKNLAGQTALHIAAARGLTGQVTRLLAARSPTGARDTNGWTPLDVAIQAKHTEAIRLLLADKSGGSHPERGVTTPLHQAAAEGNLIALAAFVDATNLEARNELGLTPLHLALQHGHLGAAALLVDKGADVNARDPDGNTLLHQILLQDRPLIVHDRPQTNWLARMGSDPRREMYVQYLTVGTYEQGPNPLLQAASFLLACGLDAKATNHAGRTVTQLVTDEEVAQRLFFLDDDRATLLKLLGTGGGSVNEAGPNGDTALHSAGQDLTAGRVASLIASGANVNATNHLGRTPLHRFAEKIWGWDMGDGSNEPFQLLLKSKPSVNAQDNDGLMPLHVLGMADTSFKREATKALLDAGANPNLRDRHGRTPIHLFLSGKWPGGEAGQCIEMLVKAGADLSLTDELGQAPLHYLVALGQQHPLFFMPGITNWFAPPKVDIAARDHEGNTPLHIAARTATSDVFEWLVKLGASLDATNSAGETPRLLASRSTDPFARFRFNSETDIFQAAREGKLETLTALLNADAALVNETNQFGQTPLRVAVVTHRTNVVEFLEAKGARWDSVSAVMAGRADVLRAILARSPRAITDTLSGRSLLHLAAADGNVDITKLLLDAGGDLQAHDPWGLSPLGAALLQKWNGVADVLVSRGASENIFDAIYGGHLKSATALLSRNKSLALAANGFGFSVSGVAACVGRDDILKLLLDNGAAADWTNPRDGRTALHVAAIYNRAAAAELLIRRGAKVAAVDRSGFTPFHLAVLRGSTEVAALLLKHKADPNLRTAESKGGPMFALGPRPGGPGPAFTWAGNAPLHLAALFGETNIITLLLKSGASINATNAIGWTALDLASQPPWSKAMPGIQLFLTPATEPPGFGEGAQTNFFGVLSQGQRAAASLLENAGAKHSLGRSPGARPPGF